MRKGIVFLTLTLPVLLATSANASWTCEFYSGCRPVYYAGYGYVCTCDTLTQNCTECCDAATGQCCVTGQC